MSSQKPMVFEGMTATISRPPLGPAGRFVSAGLALALLAASYKLHQTDYAGFSLLSAVVALGCAYFAMHSHEERIVFDAAAHEIRLVIRPRPPGVERARVIPFAAVHALGVCDETGSKGRRDLVGLWLKQKAYCRSRGPLDLWQSEGTTFMELWDTSPGERVLGELVAMTGFRREDYLTPADIPWEPIVFQGMTATSPETSTDGGGVRSWSTRQVVIDAGTRETRIVDRYPKHETVRKVPFSAVRSVGMRKIATAARDWRRSVLRLREEPDGIDFWVILGFDAKDMEVAERALARLTELMGFPREDTL